MEDSKNYFQRCSSLHPELFFQGLWLFLSSALSSTRWQDGSFHVTHCTCVLDLNLNISTFIRETMVFLEASLFKLLHKTSWLKLRQIFPYSSLQSLSAPEPGRGVWTDHLGQDQGSDIMLEGNVTVIGWAIRIVCFKYYITFKAK